MIGVTTWSDTATHEALTRLTRLAQRRPGCDVWIDRALRGRRELERSALTVAVETGDPIGQRLASLLEPCGDLERLEALAEACAGKAYVDSVYLREVGVEGD